LIGGIDTNILIYAHDNSSPFQTQALHLLENILERSVVAVAELSLREFYAVVTDGRKLNNPFSIDEAKDIISDIYASAKFVVCSTNQGTWLNGYELVGKYNISRYRLDDLLIALTLADGGAEIIYTANIKDFKKFDFIEAVNPFLPSGMPSARPVEFTEDDSVAYSTGAPCALCTIPYGRQSIDEQDVAAVCSVLRSDWITTGPKVEAFEQAVADYVGAKYAVAVSNGTAALHSAMFALGIGPGDEVIVPPITFAATANCILYQGGTPVFADVDPDTLLLDPEQVEAKITPNTKAIIGVDYAGQPCDWNALRDVADRHGLALIDDGCHALGAEYKGEKVGSVADLTVFSFHPVKHITTGEGGMVVTNDERCADRMRSFRTHGITTDSRQREAQGSWFYAMEFLGYNYRITDFQCALGLSQLKKLPKFLERRREIAALYDEVFRGIPQIEPLVLRTDVLSAEHYAKRELPSTKGNAPVSVHAFHLYVVKVRQEDRSQIFRALRKAGLGVNVHYIPVHLHPYYRKKFKIKPGLCPKAEEAYRRILSLPIFQGLSDQQVQEVVASVIRAL